MRSNILVFISMCFVACGVPAADQPPTYEQDIAPLVEAHCQGCHVSSGIAPFALTTYDQVKAMQGPARADIESRKMPPFLAAPGCTNYQNDISMTDDEIALFGKWIDSGSLQGTPAPSGSSSQAVSTPTDGLKRVDATLSMAQPYTPTKSPDDYRCFVVDWPETADKYVTGFRVVPGNPKIVHHVIAYLATPDKVAALQALDDADPGPGYTCFGGAGAGVESWLGIWAPGGTGAMYPDNTGLLVQAGSKIVMQVHYNLSNGGTDLLDSTQIEVALEDTVVRRALILPWTNPDWLKGQMDIPAFQSDVVHSWAYDPTPFMGELTKNVIPGGVGIRLYSVAAHQHLLGTSSKIEILRQGETTPECMLDIPRWDFHWQRSYVFAQGKIFHPGDQLSIECHWDNSAAAQPIVNGVQQMSHDLNWGEGTGDEMCLGILYASE
jgi:hypothetical protein